MARQTDALILFSHGSLLCGAGCALQIHAERLRARGRYVAVEVGYLNYSRPPFAEAVRRCVETGARRIVVAPYFLVPGKFVTDDLPPQIERARTAWPGIDFAVADVVGFDEVLVDAALELAERARGPESWYDEARRAPDYCQASARCPLHGTPQCPASPGAAIVGATS